MAVKVAEHLWVMHTITPVSILPNDEGDPIIFVDPDQRELAEQEAVYGCQTCGVAMVGNHNTQCEGDPDA